MHKASNYDEKVKYVVKITARNCSDKWTLSSNRSYETLKNGRLYKRITVPENCICNRDKVLGTFKGIWVQQLK
uniref:NTR domain-containing protein n=1 Tax=Schistosoma mansoni TaxID=6183 RepID=A0A5K4F9T1_SCHMA